MSIEFSCPNCQKTLRTGDDKAGKTAKCPGCGTAVTVPDSAESAADDGEQFDYDDYAEEDYGGGDYGTDEFSGAGGSGTKTCPMCGEQIKAAAVRCRFCGEDFEDRRYVSTRGPRRDSSLAIISLISSISGLLFIACCGCISLPASLMGIITGVIALNQIKAGSADGKGMAIAGIVIGAVTLLLFVVLIIFGVAMEMGRFRGFSP